MSNFVSNSDAATLFEAVGKKKLTVTDTMPTAAEANVGVSYLYLGADTQDFEEGGVYKCQEVTPATDPKTYEYIHIFTAKVDLSLYKRIFGGTVAAWDLLTDEQKAQYEYTFFDGDSNDYFAVVDAVTDGDMHPVTSNAVYDANKDIKSNLDNEAVIRTKLGSHNLLPFDAITATKNGVTFTVNSDQSVTVNGTATADTEFNITKTIPNIFEGMVLTGSPVGFDYKASILVSYLNDYGIWVGEQFEYNNNVSIILGPTQYPTRTYIKFAIYIKSGQSVINELFKPMLRISEDNVDTYMPYAATNRQLTESKMNYADNGILGAKNLWDISSVHPTGGNGGGSASYSNGVITVNCPAVLNSGAYITGSQLRSKFANLNGIPIIISFDVKGDSSFNATVGPEVGGTAEAVLLSTSYLHKEYLFNGAEDIKTLIFYTQEASQTHTITVTNFMLRLATDNDSTYQSYAMTNNELTDCLTSGDFAPSFGYIYGTKATIAGTADEALVIKETENEDFKDIVIRDASDTTRYKLHFGAGDVTISTFDSNGSGIRNISLSYILKNFATKSEYLYANTLAIYKWGRMVWITGYVPAASYTSDQATTLATIPADYPKPELTVRAIAAYSSQAYLAPEGVGYLTVTSDGTVGFRPSQNITSKTVYFEICYIGKSLV